MGEIRTTDRQLLTGREIILDDLYWPAMNERDREIILLGSKGTKFRIPPGGRLILPKQVEALEACRIFKATLLEGGMGGGKSIAGEACLNDLLFEWSTPGHTHGLDPTPCMAAHEGLNVFLIGQTLTDIRRRNLKDWMDRFGEFGTLNKNEWEFTYHDSYGSHVVVMVGSDDPKKLRGTKAAAAFHDECTLDSDFLETFRMTMKRLRQAGVPHRPWIGATNTTGPSRMIVKQLFIDRPQRDPETGRYPPYCRRPTMRDKKTGKYFPGYTNIHSSADDNPFIDDDTRREMLEGSEFEVQAYYYGSWDHPEGAMFQLEPGVHIVKEYPIGDNYVMGLAIDFGWDHPTVAESGLMDLATGRIVHNLCWSMDRLSAMSAKMQIYEYFADMRFPIERASIRVGDVSGKRGATKMKASGLADSSDWKIFNSETTHGNLRLPSFRLRPAYKDRLFGWKAVREELDFDWEWRKIDENKPLSNENRVRVVTKPPTTVILASCWQTVSSLTNLQRDKTRQDDAQKTTGVYGPAKGDDEADDFRYLVVAMRKNKFGRDREREAVEDAEALDPRYAIRNATFGRRSGRKSSIYAG